MPRIVSNKLSEISFYRPARLDGQKEVVLQAVHELLRSLGIDPHQPDQSRFEECLQAVRARFGASEPQ